MGDRPERDAFLRAARDADPLGRMSLGEMLRADDLFKRAAADAWLEHMAAIYGGRP